MAIQEQKQQHSTNDLRPPGSRRLLITFSVFLSLVVGVPFWWKCTEVYRAPLPFAEIEHHERHLNSSKFSLLCHLQVMIVSKSAKDEEKKIWDLYLEEATVRIKHHMQKLINGNKWSQDGCGANSTLLLGLDARSFCLRKSRENASSQWPCGLINSNILEKALLANDGDLDDLLLQFSQDAQYVDDGGIYTIIVFDGLDVSTNVGSESAHLSKTVIGKHRHAWIESVQIKPLEENGFEVLIAKAADIIFGNHKPEVMPIAADGSAILSFSLLNAQPNDWIYSWNFKQIEERFLSTMLDALKPVAQLSVESQILYYTPKAVEAHWDFEHEVHIVTSKNIPFFVNANEWHLDTSTAAAGRSKLLHFAIYIPSHSECPLHLRLPSGRLSQTNGFTSPGWGGVTIWNPPTCNPEAIGSRKSIHQLSIKDMEPVMAVVIAQLRSLFGLPASYIHSNKSGFFAVPNLQTGFTKWELDILLRRRAVADVMASVSTLASLSRLVQSLPNMVIKDEIGVQVKTSLQATKEAKIYAHLGHYRKVAEAAVTARTWAEQAFFHPSIMSLLHFPAEHTFAIYTPFFVPVLLHVLVSVLKESKRYYKKTKTCAQ